ncbi:MAG: hypothetical protein K2X27_01870 [Candidatus Obscuribacterales bacterium]|nr:hypothetical protein [Candidatus Obscuribacterales bacterium]
MALRSKQTMMVLPSITWKVDDWTPVDPPIMGSNKELLLRQSLELIKGTSGNEQAVREIIENALEQRLYNIAFEAVEAFGSDSSFDMCVCIGDIFELKYWKYIPKTLLSYCERRVINSGECRSGLGFANHFADQRSRALGTLGRYNFFNGKIERALELWDAADDQIDVDDIIGEMCELIAKNDRQHLAFAISLTNYVITKNIKAKILARLSKYAE